MQARAHALLKAKEAELRTAREDAQAERAAELAAAQQQAAALSKHLSQVTHAPTPQILLASFLRPLVPSALIALNLFLSKDLGQVRQHTEASC